MSKYIAVDGYHIKKDKLAVEEYETLKKKLTVSPVSGDFGGEKIYYNQFRETETEIIIPKFFGITRYGMPKKILHEPEHAKIPFIVNLRDYQIPIVNKCVDDILANSGCQLSVPCGRGKTVMAISIAHKLGLKTLVIVHKSFLQDQWIERIKQFTGLDAGIIRRDIIDIDDKMICVGMAQSLGSRDYGNIFDKFGLVVCDECHHYGAELFSLVVAKVAGAAFTLGLSATLYRNDGLIDVVHWHLGPVAYKETMKKNDQVYVKFLTFTSTEKDKFVEKHRHIKGGKILTDVVKMMSNLIDINSRNNVIINVINELRKDPKRKILILSERRDNHTKILKEKLDEMIKNDIKNGILLEDECKTAIYTGMTKKEDRIDAEKNADILFATYSMAAEGLDIERLNTLVMATPKKDANQAVGRVLRKVLENGDTRPLIVDIVDNLPIFVNQSNVREQFYTKNNYNLNYYYMLDENFISVRKFKELSGVYSDYYSDKIPTLENILTLPVVDFSKE